VNAEGDYQSYYTFKFPYDQPIKVYLPFGTPPSIEFSELAIASTPPSDPSYPSLIELINSLFANGSFTGTADVIPLNPAIPGLGGTVQSAIAALNNKPPTQFDQQVPATDWLWNHDLGFRPKPQVYNLAWQEIDAEVIHYSVNQLRVKVNPPSPGFILI
jgi:hypothetical protein